MREADVRRQFKLLNSKKSAGSNGITPRFVKNYANHLSGVFINIFNLSFSMCEVPHCFKKSVMILVPKKASVSCLNDDKSVALTFVVMKTLEHVVLCFLAALM